MSAIAFVPLLQVPYQWDQESQLIWAVSVKSGSARPYADKYIVPDEGMVFSELIT